MCQVKTPTAVAESRPAEEAAALKAKYAGRSLSVVRGVIYDITDFVAQHPGGREIVNLAVGRDATIMVESYHMRNEVVDKRLASLPQVTDLTVEDLLNGVAGTFDSPCGESESGTILNDFCTPGASTLYTKIRTRVRKEILGKLGRQMGRGHLAFDYGCVLAFWVLCATYYLKANTLFSALLLGAAASWIGMGVQHTANHGGLTSKPLLNQIMGLTNDITCGGSSLMWRYHHQVSHHLYTNDVEKDMDVYSSFPMMRFDDTQPREWFHKLQVIYAPISFSLLYWSVHIQDWSGFLNKKIFDVSMLGLTRSEQYLFVLGKILHHLVTLIIPLYLHGTSAILPFLLFTSAGSMILAWLFIVSHNIEDTKPSNFDPKHKGDWAAWQIATSASWGGKVWSFFTGGLNLQIEHHLFPGLAHNLYPQVQTIVEEECEKAGIKYNKYNTLTGISIKMMEFMRQMGIKDKVE